MGPPRHSILPVLAAVLAAALATGGCADDNGGEPAGRSEPSAADATFGPQIPPNPHLGPAGTAAMHGDSGSSDTTPFRGPGVDGVDVTEIDLGGVCSVVAVGGDGLPVALCTRLRDAVPVVHLLDPDTGSPLASLDVVPGALLGGVYGYLDEADRMVMVDGNSDLIRIAHRQVASGWVVEVDETTPLAGDIPPDESVTSVSPAHDGAVWFATDGGTVGVVDPQRGSVATLRLGPDERVSNSISTAPEGMSVASTHALYFIARDDDGRPEVRWRHAYDRGSARNPGQLSWGTGSTPTFFGPDTGSDYLAIVDNADDRVHLVVVAVSGPDAGESVCSAPVLSEGGPGSENSPIGAGRSVFVAGTYGHPYPRLPDDAGPSQPAEADFAGGMTRVDLREGGSGCEVVWDTDLRSTAVPKLSTADRRINTITRTDGGSLAEEATHAYAVIDADGGSLLAEQELGAMGGDPLQLAGTITEDGVLYQGTLGSVLRVEAAAHGSTPERSTGGG